MSDSNRNNDLTVGIAALFIIVVGFAASLTIASYRYEHASERKEIAATEANQGRREITVDCAGVGSGAQRCTAVLPPSESADKATEYDLRAQQEMAEWALGMFIATVVGLAVSAAGLWALFRNLSLQRQATNAATTALGLQQKQFLAERRPWVAITGYEIQEWKLRDGGLHIGIDIALTNMGQTPALYVDVKCKAVAALDPSTIIGMQDEIRAEAKKVRPEFSMTIFQNTPMSQSGSAVVTNRDMLVERDKQRRETPEQVSDPKVRMMPAFYGVVRYESPHGGDVHTSGFLISVTLGGKPHFELHPEALIDQRLNTAYLRLNVHGLGWSAD